MDEKPTTGSKLHASASDVDKDPDAGQAMGPHGEAPEDPAARSLYRGCLMMLLVVGILLAISSLLYRLFFTA